MSADKIVGLIALLACLFLATRSLSARRLPFETKAWMIVTWALIIVVLAFVISRFA